MERQWSGNPRRLSRADLSEIERLIWGGETFAAAAAAVGCSTKSIHTSVACGARRALAGFGWRRLVTKDRDATRKGSLDDLAGGWLERSPQGLSGMASRQGGGKARPATEAVEAGGRFEVVPGGRAWAARGVVSPADRGPLDQRLSCGHDDARLSRDDLQDSFHPGARGVAQRAHGLSANGASAATTTHAD